MGADHIGVGVFDLGGWGRNSGAQSRVSTHPLARLSIFLQYIRYIRCASGNDIYPANSYIRFRSLWLDGYILDDLMKYPEKLLLKLPAGTLAAIDLVGSNRSEFIRSAVQSALVPSREMSRRAVGGPVVSDGVRSSKPVPVQKNSIARADLKDGDLDVLAALADSNLTERSLAKVLGWTEMRVSKAVARLSAAGLVKFTGGSVEAL